MATLMQRLFNPYSAVRQDLFEHREAKSNLTLANENLALSAETTVLQESLTNLMRFVEDANWETIGGYGEDETKGFTLDAIKDNAIRTRPLLAVNPTIKKAINARAGYIWGRGVTFKNMPGGKLFDDLRNQKVVFSDNAHWRLESLLSTDGNVWAAHRKTKKEIFTIPLTEIKGWVLDGTDTSRVNYWLREWTEKQTDFATGVETTVMHKYMYPASDLSGNAVSMINGVPVDRTTVVTHVAANRQDGWILGLPDIMASMFWARAHKELFESGTTYVKAQGRFASKVVGTDSKGVQSSAARIAEAPRRDPMSGEVLDTGGTALMSGGLDLQLMGKMSGGVDFDKFNPVASLVAVGLGIPTEVLLGTSDSDVKSLERTTLDEMRLRQHLWAEFFVNLVGVPKLEVIFPKIRTEPEYRRLQAVELANNTNVLHRSELRMLTLEGFDIEGDEDDLPDIEEQPMVAINKATSDHAVPTPNAGGDVNASGSQGRSGRVGKLSTGQDAKNARNDPTDTNTKNE